MYKNYIKRILDFIAAFLLILLSLPLFLIISLSLLIQNKGKILFRQVRPGKSGVPFTIYKFRTMNEKKGPDGELLPDKDRLTLLGKLIRRSSLDELPQLFNVLIGDLSLIGPRPLLMEYLPLYNEHQAKRHAIRPGITGWAQVNGRNAISWEEKFGYDVWYVNNISFLLDLKILWLTIYKVISSKDINQQGHATIEKFKGSINKNQ